MLIEIVRKATMAEVKDTKKPLEKPQVPYDSNIKDMGMATTFEFGRPLSCKWSTGHGPRIGCVRDYPADLQCKALEQVNLSPRLISSPAGNKVPIPSPRPSPKIRLSPRLAYMGIPSPKVSLTLPDLRRTQT